MSYTIKAKTSARAAGERSIEYKGLGPETAAAVVLKLAERQDVVAVEVINSAERGSE